MFCPRDDIGAIVADIGSYATRVGFAGDDFPKAYFPSVVGTISGESSSGAGENSMEVDASGKKQHHFDIEHFREGMVIESPIQDGLVRDWDLFEKLWDYSVSRYVKTDIRETPVLMAEKPYNSPKARQEMCELIFEKYRAPAFFLSKDAVLSCYACGKTTGLVIDVGASGTTVTPVLDGWVDTKGLTRSVVSGRYMDSHVADLLKTRGVDIAPHFRLKKTLVGDKVVSVKNVDIKNIHSTYDAFMSLELVRILKESVCRMSEQQVLKGDPKLAHLPSIPYELPDGTIVDIGAERFLVPEVLCDMMPLDLENPMMAELGWNSNLESLLPSARESVPRLICDSVLRCETDVQTNLFGNMVVTGGGSSFEFLPDRIKLEVERIVHVSAPACRIKTMAAGATERAVCTWLGGSILASIGAFHEMWISRQEYNEFGASLIDRKCP